MWLWGSARTIRRRMLCLWLLLVGLLILALSDLFNGGTPQEPATSRRTLGPPDDLDLMVQSQNAALELVADFPINSLQEDQLLFVGSTQGTKNPPHNKKWGYKVLLPAAKKQDREWKEKVSLPEVRHPECLGELYSESLPSASVVICFHDEAWAILLRTLHSVLNTAPKAFLMELLLVDDFSTQDNLKTMLSEYVSNLDGVRLIRSTKRLGVGGCRSLGASRASGEVLVFMDSHCECHSGWLEPLLERVAQDRTRVVSPLMDAIHWQTFQYNATQWPVWGVFNWNLDFYWESKPEVLDKDPDLAVEPVLSPALGGGVLAMDRHFFHKVGAYDPGILLWGGEQIELSIRVWSCGGSMEVVPCSRVALVDHQHHLPYRFRDQEQIERNKIRIADTWMDAYRKIFYRRDTLAHFIRQSESSNITERLLLKRTLGCRDFHWYLTTVYPQLYIPQDRPGLSGELYNIASGGCVDYRPGHGGAIIIAPCSGTGSQHCDLNSDGEVRWGPEGVLCMVAAEELVVLSECASHPPISNKHQWKFMKLSGQLVHQQSQLCLEAVKQSIPLSEVGSHSSAGDLFLRPCTPHSTQQWHFEQLVSP
ncbi:polypeptide N-acetylgalactosaminyltransferase 15-like isoform X1 [Dunckerocampus dactyliophorus]|uniref:polypeptide N-acetylgalactosaminyltransferase 15-like isoform X1 n=2 Tax=Dunckerocampus dactyliophorus TaxID=161453 RepID=UPI00240699A4|nr:polypeptide N-acetylgalactosaminyltransferase 15-like isoform X1 [Dunckerocampus dactyliophorus]XP_054619765.1 polypeptide N-acetylgalactosaminyltransferase 15-like isoform X1 [Dunckerocampus dactyliophorus]